MRREQFVSWLQQRVLQDGERTVEDLVLQFGQPFEMVRRPKAFRLRRAKECFNNALTLALEERGEYCEGFASYAGEYPFHHAWVCLPDGSAVEVTLKDPSNCSLYGVRFRRPVLLELERQGYGRYGFLSPPCDRDLLRQLLDAPENIAPDAHAVHPPEPRLG